MASECSIDIAAEPSVSRIISGKALAMAGDAEGARVFAVVEV